MLKKLVISLCLVSVVSCAPKIKNFSEFKKQPILRSKLVSKKEIKKTRPSVVVLNFNNRDSKVAKKTRLGNSLAVTTENILSESKLVKLADRRAFKKLSKEIALAEMNETGSYKGPSSVDYAVSGDISTAGFNHKFISAKSRFNATTKRYTRTPARNKYTATFSGNLKIYKVPSLEVVEVIALNGEEHRFEDAVENRSWFKTTVDTSAIKKEDNDMIRKAAVDALDVQRHVLKNIFSSLRKGYITSKKSDGKRNIFKIALGKSNGIEHGQKVKIFTKEKTKNELTDEVSVEEIEIGQGVVSNIITGKSAWVIVKDKNVADQIKMGDHVTVAFKKKFSRHMKSFSNVVKR